MLELIVTTLVAALMSDGLSRAKSAEVAQQTELGWGMESALEALDSAIEHLDSLYHHDEDPLPSTEEAVAELGLQPDTPTAYLGAISIPDAYRSRGLGTLLMRAMEDEARRQGAKIVVLYATEQEGGDDPRRFYAALGYNEYLHHPYGSVMYRFL